MRLDLKEKRRLTKKRPGDRTEFYLALRHTKSGWDRVWGCFPYGPLYAAPRRLKILKPHEFLLSLWSLPSRWSLRAFCISSSYLHSQQKEVRVLAMATSTEISPVVHDANVVERKSSRTTSSSDSDRKVIDPEAQEQKEIANDEIEVEEARSRRQHFYKRYRPVILGLVAAVILGWWISSTILTATRHRWYLLPSYAF